MTPSSEPGESPLLSVENLSIGYRARAGEVPAVRDVSFTLQKGESLGLVGESGCGKSTLAYAVMNYLGRSGRVREGRVVFEGRDLSGLRSEEMRALRGKDMAMVYQDPMSCLNPVLNIGAQLMEVPIFHDNATWEVARAGALAALNEVQLADPEAMLQRYPHQLSGGQQQRVVIAMALMSNPRLLVMDEPTTGLDVTIEAAILELIAELRRRHDMALLFISHNLGTVMRVCDRIGVMYLGQLVEEGPLEKVFNAPTHPYTRGLLDCLPRLDRGRESLALLPIPGQMPSQLQKIDGCIFAARCPEVEPACRTGEALVKHVKGHPDHRVRCCRVGDLEAWDSEPEVFEGVQPPEIQPEAMLEIESLQKTYKQSTSWGNGGHNVRALNGVSIAANRGQTLAVVGESGCGKSTLAKILTGLEEATGGKVRFQGEEISRVSVQDRSQEMKSSVQMVFQHPDGTLNPSHTVGFAISRTLRRLTEVPSGKMQQMVRRLLRTVNLPEQFARRLPRQLSGGQKQRVAIARALAGNPSLVIADEPVSALDVSVQAAIINLLLELQVKHDTTMVFISHDLAVVRYLADQVAVMYLGKIMEFGSADDVFSAPYHPYTEALLASVPSVDTASQRPQVLLDGALPSTRDLPRGCPFYSRCPRSLGDLCRDEAPLPLELGNGHRIACHIPLEELNAVESVIEAFGD